MSITVPGAAMGWEDVRVKYGSGKVTLLELLTPSIGLAERCFSVAPMTSHAWRAEMYKVDRRSMARDERRNRHIMRKTADMSN
jgi:gamma-glutamyltranspeptidase/glutathione hydrolase